jgi:predicted ATPase
VTVLDLTAWAARYEVIVLEGCDGIGKTTLATALSEGHGYQRMHATRTPEGVDLAERYRAILRLQGRLVLDRCFISELVYGPLLHGYSRLTLAQAVVLSRFVAARNGVLVHLTGRPVEIRTRLQARDGISPDLDHLQKLIRGYA